MPPRIVRLCFESCGATTRVHGKPRPYLGRVTAIDNELTTSHPPRLVRSQVQHAPRDVVRLAESSYRMQRDQGLPSCLRVLRSFQEVLYHRRPDEARVYRVDPYCIARVEQRIVLGHEPYGPFRGVIGRRVARTYDPVDRREIDDASAFGLTHVWDGVLCTEKATLDVHREDTVPFLFRYLMRRLLCAADSGVVHQHVQPPERTMDVGKDFSDRHFAGDVEGPEPRRAAGLADIAHDLLALLFENIGDGYSGAFSRQHRAH
jgi:hypothetical protein